VPSVQACDSKIIALYLVRTESNEIMYKFMNVNVIFGGGPGLFEGTVAVFGCKDPNESVNNY
jgi:hypothetical protein